MASFENKTVIVTGCSSGVGLATTRLFLSRKARVFGIDISPFKAELDPSQSASFAFHQANLTAPDAADTAVAACQAKFGRRIDALANVAGIMDNFGSVDSLKDEDWDRVIAVNLTAPVRLMRAVIPAMREQKSGAIVNVGSVASMSGGMSGVAYTASKHGIAGATKNVAWRYRFEGIRANCVLPGGVATNIQNSVAQETWDKEAMAVITPIHQLQGGGKEYNPVEPIEIAEAIVFLSSDQSKTVNGLMMSVDTGYCALG